MDLKQRSKYIGDTFTQKEVTYTNHYSTRNHIKKK